MLTSTITDARKCNLLNNVKLFEILHKINVQSTRILTLNARVQVFIITFQS